MPHNPSPPSASPPAPLPASTSSSSPAPLPASTSTSPPAPRPPLPASTSSSPPAPLPASTSASPPAPCPPLPASTSASPPAPCPPLPDSTSSSPPAPLPASTSASPPAPLPPRPASTSSSPPKPAPPTLTATLLPSPSASSRLLSVHLSQPSGTASSWVVQTTRGWWAWPTQHRVLAPEDEAEQGLLLTHVGGAPLRVRAYALSRDGKASGWGEEAAAEPEGGRRVAPRVLLRLLPAARGVRVAISPPGNHAASEAEAAPPVSSTRRGVVSVKGTEMTPLRAEAKADPAAAAAAAEADAPRAALAACGGGEGEAQKGLLACTSSAVGSTLRGLGRAVGGTFSELAGSAVEASIDSALVLGHAVLRGGRRDVIMEREAWQARRTRPLPPALSPLSPPRPRPPPLRTPQAPKPSAPPFAYAEQCEGCVAAGEPAPTFGLARHRHHCRHCGGSFCADHLRWRCRLPKFEGLETPQRVCEACVLVLRREEYENRGAERAVRVADFVAGALPPFEEVLEDTAAAKARRVGRAGLQLAKSLPLSGRAMAAIHSIDAMRKFGRLGVAGVLLKDDLINLLVMLRTYGSPASKGRSLAELAGALYYSMARQRALRGCNPLAEAEAHAECTPASVQEVEELSELAPLALNAAYQRTLVDAQRHAALRGFELLFAQLSTAHNQTAFLVVGQRARRVAVVAVRGTNDLSDAMIDARALGQRLDACGATGWAHSGMLTAARWLLDELRAPLLQLAAAGYRLVLTGHSLGAGVATLLAALLRPLVGGVRCVGFATPPVASGEALLAQLEGFCVTIVHRNDAIPRTTIKSCTQVVTELASYDEWKVDAREDWQGIKLRARQLWSPQLRQRALLAAPPTGRASDAPCAALPAAACVAVHIAAVGARLQLQLRPTPHGGVAARLVVCPPRARVQLLARGEARRPSGGEAMLQAVGGAEAEGGTAGGLALEQLSGGGVEADGLSSAPADAEAITAALYAAAEEEAAVMRAAEEEARVELERDEAVREERAAVDAGVLAKLEESAGEFAFEYDPKAPTLRVPGKVLKLYQVHGVYRACWVPCEHASLAQIVLVPHMISDHLGKAYLSALKSVKAAMHATRAPPAWVPFDVAPPTCACCASPFSWESTLKSQAQQVCARHHCRSCGRVVCDPCSKNRACLPEFGIVQPARVCDACYYQA
ncbi:hypothetical protein AB1Y20_008743 [Prymnesium parvum]|uniref:sn-1-specific diacylglycerol lipase n=1 Tax=Prymnesium parvum TaxID=97485 RepID=A0AB34ITW9_PRYPA